MSGQDDKIRKDNQEDETTLEEFLEHDSYAGDKIIVQKKPKRTVVLTKYDNNSGMGELAPYNVSRKYNWGAFLFNWIWGIKYKRWVLLLVPFLFFIPYGFLLSFLVAFFAGTKGNQWAWEEIQYKDEQDFHQAQKSWVKAWFVCVGIVITIAAPIYYMYNKEQKTEDVQVFDPLSAFSSLELRIPSAVYDQTTTADNHSEILTSDKNVIYWVRPKNALTEKNKEDIIYMYERNPRVKDNFVLYPDLKALKDETVKVVGIELEASCINDTCVDDWLYKACNKGYCLINPKTGKYYKVRGKSNVISKASKVLRDWR